MKHRVFLNEIETEELAAFICDLDYDEIDSDSEIINDKLSEKFNIDLNDFTFLVSNLLPLIDVGKSPITDERFKGFSNQEELWLLKTKI